MTNPNNAIGTNAAYSGRTSANAFNDVLSVLSRGIVSGWACSPDSGMSVVLGGDGTTRDVAIAEDNIGNRTTINNISGTPVSVTIGTAPLANSRIDLIVAYVDNPPEGTSTITDNYEACGLIVVQGTASASPTAPNDSDIRTAITTDGGSGVTAYYVVLAEIAVASGTTVIDESLITQGGNAGIANQNIQDEAVTADKFAQYAVNSAIETDANLSPASDTPSGWNTLLDGNGYFVTYYRQSGIFTNQPATYGLLETINHSGRIEQRWVGSDGALLYRSGTAEGWTIGAGAFRQIVDGTYSTTERIFGTWIDGKTIYKKTIDFGALPNATEKTVPHNIANLGRIINMEAWAYRQSPYVTHTCLPYVYSGNAASDIGIAVSVSSIAINAAADRSNFTECYVTLYYTKSS